MNLEAIRRRLRSALQSLLWRFASRIAHTVLPLGPYRIHVSLDAAGADRNEVEAVVEQAVEVIKDVAPVMSTFTARYCPHIILTPHQSRGGIRALPGVGGLLIGTDFVSHPNPRVLALYMVWGAHFNQRAAMLGMRDGDVRLQSYEQAVAFAKRFQDWPDWLEYLQPLRPPEPLGPTGGGR
jgi:hypothetical protein